MARNLTRKTYLLPQIDETYFQVQNMAWQVEGWTDFNPYFHPRENLRNYSVAIYDLRQTPSVLFLHLQNGYQWAQYRAGHKGGNKGEATAITDDNWVHASPPSSLRRPTVVKSLPFLTPTGNGIPTVSTSKHSMARG